MVVKIEDVIANGARSEWHTRQMEKTLQKQGQIEPLQVWAHSPNCYVTFHQDPWGADIVHAARNLGWTTLLIHVTTRYEV